MIWIALSLYLTGALLMLGMVLVIAAEGYDVEVSHFIIGFILWPIITIAVAIGVIGKRIMDKLKKKKENKDDTSNM